MKLNHFRGFNHVFLFTLMQSIKTKANQVTFIITLFIFMALPPVFTLAFRDKEEVNLDVISTVYLVNDTQYQDISMDYITRLEAYSHLNFIQTKDSLENLKEKVDDLSNNALLLSIITSEDNTIYLSSYTALSDISSSEEFHTLKNLVLEELSKTKLNTLDLTNKEKALLSSKSIIESKIVDIEGNEAVEEDTTITDFAYWLIYATIFILTLLCSYCSGMVTNSIVTEKSTRVIEYLLITVHPVALLLGKVTAIVTFYILQLSIQIIGLILSNKITSLLFNQNINVIEMFIPQEIMNNITPINIITILVLLIFGLLIFSTLASICGAMVSRIEELQEGMTFFILTLLLGSYLSLAASNVMLVSGTNSFVIFALLFPLSSPFLLSGAMIASQIPWYLIIISLVIQVIFTLILINIAAKIYTTLVLYNGNRIKFKNLRNILRNS